MATSSCRILYIEDDLDNQMLLSFYTKNEDIELDMVGNGTKALDKLQSDQAYDLLIIDWNLPGALSGAELLAEIRIQSGYKHTPILILTAHANRDDLANLDDEEISGCLFKPIKKQDLIDRVNEACSEKKVPR